MNIRSYARNTLAVVGLLGFAGTCHVERQAEAYAKGCPQIEELASAYADRAAIDQTTIAQFLPGELPMLLQKRAGLEQRIAELEAIPCVVDRKSPYFEGVYLLMFAAGLFGAAMLVKDKKS